MNTMTSTSSAHEGSLRRFARHLLYVMTDNPVTAVAFGLFLLIVIAALLGPWLVPYNPLATDASSTLLAPSWQHWFGTDHLGRDVFSRVVVATRLDLMIAVTAVAIAFVVGSTLGAIAGFYGGFGDDHLIEAIVLGCSQIGAVPAASRATMGMRN